MSWQDAAENLRASGLSGREIAKRLGKSKSTVNDYFKSILSRSTSSKEKTYDLAWFDELAEKEHDNQRILFISDLHAPYNHPNAINFLHMLKERYDPTRVVCLGDEVDYHALSFHDSDPDLDSAGVELEKAIGVIQELHELFPVMDIIDSNHGSMVFRKAKHHGIPVRAIKSYNDVLGVPDTWTWHNDMVLDLPSGPPVYVHHGKTSEALKTSQLMGMSHVCGHYHESFGIKYWANPRGLYFGINSGCLIDDKRLAFAYNKINPKRPIIGTSLIIDGVPILEAMPL